MRAHAARIGDELIAWAEDVEGGPMLEGVWGHGPYRVPASIFAVPAIHHGTTHRLQIGDTLRSWGAADLDTDGWSWSESGGMPAG